MKDIKPTIDEVNESSVIDIDVNEVEVANEIVKESSHTQEQTIEPIHPTHQRGNKKSSSILTLVTTVALSSMFGFGGGYYANTLFNNSSSKPAVFFQNVIPTTNKNDDSSLSYVNIAALTADSVVEITTETMKTGNFMQQAIAKGAGSGVIISIDGYIVTNNHVVEDSSKITVRLKDGTTFEAKLIGTDMKSDIALLKIEKNNLQAAIFGDSSSLQVGESVIAVGNPLGQLGGTVTNGIISALDREITIDHETMRLLQTNAAINPGNSGGGLFNMRGELIGIVNAKSSGSDIEGLGFAIPSNDAKKVISDILEFGYVKGRVQLGVTLLDITTQEAALAYRVAEFGVYIQSVSENSSAQEAGLQIGDRIVSFNSVEITSFSQLKGQLARLEVGAVVPMIVKRANKEVTLQIKLKEYNPLDSITKKG